MAKKSRKNLNSQNGEEGKKEFFLGDKKMCSPIHDICFISV